MPFLVSSPQFFFLNVSMLLLFLPQLNNINGVKMVVSRMGEINELGISATERAEAK